jgi:hypothetical protein
MYPRVRVTMKTNEQNGSGGNAPVDQGADYCDYCFSWISSVPPDKRRHSTYK